MKLAKILGLAAVGAMLGGAAQADTIKIGVVLPFSGVNADLGNQMVKAYDLYQKVHGNKVGDHTIELVKRDEGPPSGAAAKTVVTELITNDKVSMVIGFSFSPSAIAAIPVINQAKVPMIISNAGTAWITTLSPYVVRFSFSMWHPGYAMGTYAAKDLGCKTAAMGYTDFPPGKDSTEAFKTAFEKAGGKVIDTIPMGNPAQVPDFTPFFQRVKDEKPSCFYVFIPSGAHAAGIVKTYGEVGLKQAGIKLIGPMDIIPDNKLQDMGDAAVGAIVMSHYAADLDNPQNKEFIKAWYENYPKDTSPDFMSAAAWDTMAGIYAVVKKLDGKVSDGQKVVDAFKGYTADSPRGKISIDPKTRDIVQDERAEEVIKKPDGKLGIKVLGVVPQVKDECKELKVGRCGS